MNNNYQVMYTTVDEYMWWRGSRIVRFLIPDKVYFYNLFVGVPARIFRYLPLRPYMNNTGFKL